MGVEASRSVDDSLVEVASGTAGLELLLLYGSRARGDARPDSDWDFGFLGDAEMDVAGLMAHLVETVGSDRLDLVDLGRAGGLLRYRAARDGRLIYEARPGIHDEFRWQAVRFWCDMEPVIRRGYEQVLARLER